MPNKKQPKTIEMVRLGKGQCSNPNNAKSKSTSNQFCVTGPFFILRK